MLHEIGLIKSNNGTWVCKADGGSIGGAKPCEIVAEEFIVAADETMAAEYAMVPYNHPVDCGEPLSGFEQMILGRLDNIVGDQVMHH